MLVLVIGNLVFGFTIAIAVAVAFAYQAFFFLINKTICVSIL